MNYIFISIISALFFTTFELLYKFSNLSLLNVDYYVSLWYIICGIISVFYFISKKYNYIKLEANNLLLFIIIGVLTFVGNIIYFTSCKNIDNPGITRGVYSGTLILSLALISSIIFNKGLSYIQILSIILITIGIMLLLFNKN